MSVSSALLAAMPAPAQLSRHTRLERGLLQRIHAAGWLSHATLGELCGVSERAVGAWLSGMRPYPRGLLLVALEGLDTPRRRLALRWLDELLTHPTQLSLLDDTEPRDAIGQAALSLLGTLLRGDDDAFERALIVLEDAVSRYRCRQHREG